MQKNARIGVEQILELRKHIDLGIDKNTIRKIVEFKMPNFEEVQAYVDEHCPEIKESELVGMKDESELFFRQWKIGTIRDNLKYTYKYYEGHTVRPQRRLIRYLGLYMAMFGIIDVNENPQVKQDLIEVDINLEKLESIQSGKKRIGKSFPKVLKKFISYENEASKLSNYIDNPQTDEYWQCCCTDDERFGKEELCNTSLYPTSCDLYVESTKGQIRKMQKEQDRISEEVGKLLADLL